MKKALPKTPKDARAARLAEQLRANLARRKAQARGAAGAPERRIPGPEPSTED